MDRQVIGLVRNGHVGCLDHLARWLRPLTRGVERAAAVEPGHLERGLGSWCVEDVVKKPLALAGITGGPVHSLRHSFATAHVRKGTELAVVKEALGHRNLATTSRYVGLAREQMDKRLQEHALSCGACRPRDGRWSAPSAAACSRLRLRGLSLARHPQGNAAQPWRSPNEAE